MANLQLSLLGPWQVRLAGQSAMHFPTIKAQALLTYLAVEAQTPHTRDALTGLFWADYRTDSAHQNLRKTLQRLRKTLPVGYLLTNQQTVQFDPSSDYSLDVAQFTRCVATAHQHDQANHHLLCSTCRTQLHQAVELYHGDFLAHFFVAESPAFEEWALLKREWLRREVLHALYQLAAHYEVQGAYDQAYAYAWRQVELDPVREEAHQQLMRTLALRGRRSEAVAQYESCRRILAEELNIQPAVETVKLYERIQRGEIGTEISEQGRITQVADASLASCSPALDWNEVPLGEVFFGRHAELAKLKQWLVTDQCRLVAILGMGGVGKTSLTVQVIKSFIELSPSSHLFSAERVSIGGKNFQRIIWRSLFNAPSLSDLLQQILLFLSDQKVTELPVTLDEKLRLLLQYLRQQRCLLILDNVEGIMQQDERAGYYRPGYEEYGQLFQRIAQSEHQSSFLLTSREQPKEFQRLEYDNASVRSLRLTGLPTDASHEILKTRGLSSADKEMTRLVERYSGHPLALKLVAETIQDLYAGDIAAFLCEETLIFDDIRDILDQQFARLSVLEFDLLVWLAIEREPISTQALWDNLVYPPSKRTFLETLRSLRRRSLLETVSVAAKPDEGTTDDLAPSFALQNVVTEYITAHLIEIICQEVKTRTPDYFSRYALIKAQAKDYIRESQIRLILRPVVERLLALFGRAGVEAQSSAILAQLRQTEARQLGYTGGNILNLLLQLGGELKVKDFSRLTMWQAYTQGVDLQDVNFMQSDLSRTTFTERFGAVFSVAFSPNGKLLTAGCGEGEIRVWQVTDGQPYLTVKGHSTNVWSISFSSDGSLVVSGGEDRTVCLWDFHTGHCIHTLQGHSSPVRAVCFSPDGNIVASGSEDRTIRVWDSHTGYCIRILQGHTSMLWSICFSPDGYTLASSSSDQSVRLWNVQTGECLCTLEGHTGWVRSVCFSPDGSIVASGSSDQTVRLWNVQTGQSLGTLEGHTDWIRSVCFSPDGHMLASGSSDQTVRLWNVRTGQCMKTLLGHSNWVWSVCFSPDGAMVASGCHDGSVRLWDTRTGQSVKTVRGYTNHIRSICFNPDGAIIASGNSDQTVRLWRMDSTQCVHTLQGHIGWVMAVCFSPDGAIVASGSSDQTVRLWNVRTGQCMKTLLGHTNWVWSVCFSPDGRTLASGSDDRSLCLWDMSTSQRLCTLQGHSGWVRSVCFSPDGAMVASGSSDQTVRLWNMNSAQCIRTLQGHTGWVMAICFSPDGRTLASASQDGSINLWDVHTGQCIHTLQEHTGWVMAVCFSPDSCMLASGGVDQTVRLWDVHTGYCIKLLQGHASPIYSINFSPDGQTLASCSGDETIKLWDMQNDHDFKTLRADGPYARMNITDTTGLTDSQRAALKTLGAVEW